MSSLNIWKLGSNVFVRDQDSTVDVSLDSTKLSLLGGTLVGLLNFSGTTHAGIRLNSLTTAQYIGITPADGDLFLDTTTNRVSARTNSVTKELLDTSGGQTINGALTVSGALNASGNIILPNNAVIVGSGSAIFSIGDATDTVVMAAASTIFSNPIMLVNGGPLLRNNAGTVEVRNNANTGLANFGCSFLEVANPTDWTARVRIRGNSSNFWDLQTNFNLVAGELDFRNSGNELRMRLRQDGAFFLAPINSTASTGIVSRVSIASPYNQTGTAGSCDFLVNRTETALGSGLHNFIDCQVGGTSRFSVSNAGNVTSVGTIQSNSLVVTNGTRLGTRTIATLPLASTVSGQSFIVSDSPVTANRIVTSDGTDYHYEGIAYPVGTKVKAAIVIKIDTATTGAKNLFLRVPFACTITSWELASNVSGSCVIDIWEAPYASYPPTNSNTITASAKPTLTAANKAQSSTLTGWTTAIAEGDYLEVEVESVATIGSVTLTLNVDRVDS